MFTGGRMLTVSLLCAIGGFALDGATGLSASQERELKAISGRSVAVRVVDRGLAGVYAELTKNDELIRRVAIEPPLQAVESLTVSPKEDYVGLIGRVGRILRVIGIQTRTGTVTTDTFALAAEMSPDDRFVIVEDFRTRVATRQSASYRILSLAAGAAPLAWSYPIDGADHQRQSDFFWVSDNVVAFLDLSGDRVRLVAVELLPDGSVARSATKDLDTLDLVNLREVNSDAPPASAIYGAAITRIDSPGLVLRLVFPKSPTLLARRVDVHVWQ